MDPTSNTAIEGSGRGGPRLPWLDAARGAAVVAMVVYHTAWDLSALRLVETIVTGDPAWNAFARVIASTFLALSGVGLALAHGRGVRPRAFVRRVAVLAAAAALVSVGTRVAFPDGWVFFGILHNLAVSSLLALPFVRAGTVASAVGAVVLLALPTWFSSPVLDAPPLVVLGLGTTVPFTNDWVPVFPWTGAVLAGVAVGLRLRPLSAEGGPGLDGRAGRALRFLGRHSLLVYLVHQPLIYGACLAWLQLAGVTPAAEAAPFLRGCERSCATAGEEAGRCRAACSCTVATLRREGLWPRLVRDALAPEEAGRVPEAARACLATTRGSAKPFVTTP